MVSLLHIWTTLLCVSCFIENGTSLPDLLGYWDKSYMEKEITVRIVRKDWKPLGPSGDTEYVLDEYQWDLTTAFKGLLQSRYQFEESHLNHAENIFKSSQYNMALETIIIIHPIFAGADSNFVRTTINALALRNLHKQYNIFALDLDSINNHMLISIFKNAIGLDPNYKEVADVLLPFLYKGIDGQYLRPEQIHLMGWSYSGHLVGYIGRAISLRYKKRINSILSLDPFTNELNSNLVHVSSDDAEVVHVYHSNSVLAGSRRRFGTADFVFNSGHIQPECYLSQRGITNLFPGAMACSHLRIVQRFWYMILFPSKFVARQCASWEEFTACGCENHLTAPITFPITDRSAAGTYYIRTSGSKPYGLGNIGSSCAAEKST